MADLNPEPVRQALARDPQLQPFTGGRGIETIPAKQVRRLAMLDVIAQAFEPGLRYPEREVSQFLAALHADHAALRRYLVDAGLLSRANGEYWRSGGTVPAAGPDAARGA